MGGGALFVVGLFRYPLDHTFHSAHFRLAALKALPYVGADHFPVYTEPQYDPGRGTTIGSPPPTR